MGDSSDEEEEEMAETMKCVSCKEEYGSRNAGTCRECYEEASETEEELKREIEDLKSKVNFLRFFWGPPASRSPVFRAMLENKMEESLSGTIKISDVSYDALRAFVNYLYTAEACLDVNMACDLLILAEKYQVKYLKNHCEKFLISNLSWENSIPIYAFAHQHNAKNLVDAALSLILDNMEKLRKREEYSELVEKEPRMVVELYEAYLSRQVNTAANKDSTPKA